MKLSSLHHCSTSTEQNLVNRIPEQFKEFAHRLKNNGIWDSDRG
jgi:hypothetical protein